MTNEDITPLDHIKTERNEPAAPQLDPFALRGMEHFLGKLKETIIVESNDEDVKPNIEPIPEIAYTAPEVARPNLQTLLNRDNQNDEALNNIRGFRDQIKTEIDDIIKIEDDVDGDFDGDFDDTEFTQLPPQLPPYSEIVPHIDISDNDDDPPPPYDDSVKTEPESDDDVRPKLEDPPDSRNIYTLVPPEIEIHSDDNIRDIVGNPNVNTILPPVEGDPNLTDPNPYYTDEEDLEDPGYTDDDIDFTVTSSMLYRDRINEIHRRRAKKKALKTLAKKRARKLAGIKKRKETTILPIPEIDENKIVVDEDGEVTITEPDNIQVEYKPLVPYYKEAVQLPPEDVHMIDPRTRNLVLKRRQPKDEGVNIKKYIEGIDISTRNVWHVRPAKPFQTEEDDVLSAAASNRGDSGDGGDGEEWDVKPFGNQEGLVTVDIHTMRKMPCLDFSVILRENEAEKREELIMTLLQNNMPDDNDRYYIYHDQETNTFSVELDEDAEESRDLTEEI